MTTYNPFYLLGEARVSSLGVDIFNGGGSTFVERKNADWSGYATVTNQELFLGTLNTIFQWLYQ